MLDAEQGGFEVERDDALAQRSEPFSEGVVLPGQYFLEEGECVHVRRHQQRLKARKLSANWRGGAARRRRCGKRERRRDAVERVFGASDQRRQRSHLRVVWLDQGAGRAQACLERCGVRMQGQRADRRRAAFVGVQEVGSLARRASASRSAGIRSALS